MRKWYFLAGLTAMGIAGLVSWVTLGVAQPMKKAAPAPIVERVPMQPVKSAAPIRIIDIDDSLPTAKPVPEPSPLIADPRVIPVPMIIDPLDAPKEPVRLTPEPIRIPDVAPKEKEPATKIDEPAEKTTTIVTTVESVNTMSATQPGVGLEWVGPTSLKVGQAAEYTLMVRNISPIPVQKVIVQVRIPSGVNIVNAEPKAENTDNVLVWELGNLLVKQERRLTMKVISPQRGDLTCQAWVTFTGSSVMRIKVREPKLQVKLQMPDKVMVGDPANVVMTVSNPGDHSADHVKITAILADGLESIRGNKLSYDLGTLGAGETRNVTLPCVTKAAGSQKCDVFVEADGGLKAGDSAALNVIQPQLDLAVSGPKLRYVDKKAIYAFKVSNPGDAPASNVFVTQTVPNGFKFVQADNGGQMDDSSHTVKWFLGEVAPGQSKEVKVELLANVQGEFTHKVVANASRGMKVEQELKTAVEGLSAILMEVIDVDDPVEVASDTAYEIKVTNTGTKAETDVKLICTIPAQLKLKNVQSTQKYDVVGNEIIFQPLPKLAPRADIVFKLTVTAVAKGDARFKASLTSASLVEPVIKVEPTKVYGD